MKPKRLIGLAAIVCTALTLSSGAASGATRGTHRPLRGVSTSTSTIDLGTGVGTSDGTSRLSHCGRTTFHNDFTFALQGSDGFQLVGTDTEVCANGDKVFSTFTVTGTVSTGESTGAFTITGGTGRFADARGAFTIVAQSTIVSVVGTKLVSDDANTIQGQISY